MKKILALLLVCSMTLSMFTACGGNGDTPGGQSNQTDQTDDGNQTNDTGALVETGGTITYELDSSGVKDTAAISTGSLYVTESMLDTGIKRPGSLVRLAGVLEKASYGGTLTIAYVGGSIAYGKGASTYERSYAGLTTAWLKATFPKATIKEINIAAPDCDSYYAVHRISQSVISENPDIVILDTASEDTGVLNEECFESMVKLLLSAPSSPAVIPLITTNSTYVDDGDKQSALAFKHNLPVISYADVLESNINNGTWSWANVSTADEDLCPADSGHGFIAYLLTGFFDRVIEGIPSSSYKEYTVNTATNTKVRYMDSKFIDPNYITYSGSDFTCMKLDTPVTDEWTRGLLTTTGGETSLINLTAKNIGIFYLRDFTGECGQFDVYVDDELIATLDGDLTEDTYATHDYVAYMELKKFDEVGDHEIRIVKNEESAMDKFVIMGLALSQ